MRTSVMTDDVRHWSAFESVVASLYRARRGANVHQRINLAGNQVDILLEEHAGSDAVMRTAIECKYRQSRVPEAVIIGFSTIVVFLRAAGLIDRAVIVSYKGFTPEAYAAATLREIELLTLEQLKIQAESLISHLDRPPESGVAALMQSANEVDLPSSFPKVAFVVMPFAPEWGDVYLYGIRGCLARLELTCKRADEIDHDRDILQVIIDYLRRACIIIAEVTDRNPNVLYEVGWAHALERPTVLVARSGTELPFDVSHVNTIFYKTIRDLEEQLGRRVRALLHT
jgi:hypothetical protein